MVLHQQKITHDQMILQVLVPSSGFFTPGHGIFFRGDTFPPGIIGGWFGFTLKISLLSIVCFITVIIFYCIL